MSTVRRFPFRHRLAITILVLFLLFLTACASAPSGKSEARKFVVGEVSNVFGTDRQTGLHTALASMGYVEGENITYVSEGSGITPEQLDPLVQKLVDAKVDLIVAYGTQAVVEAKKIAGTTIPIVMVGSLDPVQLGLVKSLQNTEGNLTGVANPANVYGKQLEWLVRMVPTVKRIYTPFASETSVIEAATIKQLKEVADKSGIEMLTGQVPPSPPPPATPSAAVSPAPTFTLSLTPSPAVTAQPTIDPALAAFIADIPQVDAILATATTSTANIAHIGLDRKMPVVVAFPLFVTDGALFSYNVVEKEIGAEAARFVDRIIRGAKPSDLPVELASSSLVINVKTAQAIGLTIPDDILKQANTVIR
jgi:putative ABC transport system substrate-binding protein